jgi:hypothetical protein
MNLITTKYFPTVYSVPEFMLRKLRNGYSQYMAKVTRKGV